LKKSRVIKKIIKKPELMSPAGNWTTLRAAVKAGADAVYFGIEKLNMRVKAENFLLSELKEVVSFCKKNKVKTYLTVNTIVREENINIVDKIISTAKKSGIDMIICWDFAVINKCKQYKIPFCVSTQASISNTASAKFFENLGAKRIVAARECTLEEIKKIRASTKMEIEAFIHGAMCVAVSGRCFMSHDVFGRSANEGDCLQPCRREYLIKDIDESSELILGEDYVLSAKDLCTIEFIDKLIEAGIDSFKIEGRKRSPEYVAKVVSVYRRAIDLYFENKLTAEVKKKMFEELKQVYNRGFSKGFYFGIPNKEDFSSTEGSIATTKKEFIGRVINYYKKSKVAYVEVQTKSITKDDKILILGKTTGLVEVALEKILDDEKEINEAVRGMRVTFKCKELVRPHDQVYVIKTL
jgi:putative protease